MNLCILFHLLAALNNFQEGDLSFFPDDLPSNIRMLERHFDNPEELYFMTNRDPRYDSVSLGALQFLIDYGIVCGELRFSGCILIYFCLLKKTISNNCVLFVGIVYRTQGRLFCGHHERFAIGAV